MPRIRSLLLLLTLATPLQAQLPAPRFQSNWVPNDYRFACEATASCSMDEDDRQAVVSMLRRVVVDMQSTI